MATLEEILRQIQGVNNNPSIGMSGYYAEPQGNVGGSLNSDYTQAMQYQDMVNQMNMPKQVLQYNDIPIDQDPFQAYGGRISSDIPLDLQKSLNIGLSGQGLNTEQFRPTGVDATYQSGNTGYGMSYEQLSPEQKKLLFSIFREF